VLERLQVPIDWSTEIRSENGPTDVLPPSRSLDIRQAGDALHLIPSRLLPHGLSHSLKAAVAHDDQLWLAFRKQVFMGRLGEGARLELFRWDDDKSTCLVDTSVLAPVDIRNYLSMFQTVLLVAPLAHVHSKCMQTLGVTEDELLALVQMGRVKVLFPQNVTRYQTRFVEKLVDANSDNVMLSRQIALRTVVDTRLRNPLLYPTLPISDRQGVLRALYHLAKSVDMPNVQQLLNSLLIELTRIWSSSEIFLGERGAMGTLGVGYAPLLSSMIKVTTEKDLSFEIMTSSQSVEWAGAFNATLCPTGDEDHVSNTAKVATLYSGIQRKRNVEFVERVNVALEGVLTIGRFVPAIEFAETFQGPDIDRFRRIIQALTTQHQDSQDLGEAVIRFNESVRAFEHRRDRLNTWDIKGLLLDAAVTNAGVNVPFSGFFVGLLTMAISAVGKRHGALSEAVDKITASMTGADPGAILVSRMRQRVKDWL
jgi:hypothetical protein